MASRFARLLAPLAACAVAVLVASCCCQRYSSCREESTECGPCGTTFQRLVVTNKHTKPIMVSATGWDDSGANPVEVPLKNSPASIAAGGSQAFPVQVAGTNVDRVVVSYLADDDTDQRPAVEDLTVGASVMITRCVQSYTPDAYQIVVTCP